MSDFQVQQIPADILPVNGTAPGAASSSLVVAVRALEVTGRLHDALALLGALALFVWVAAAPDVLRLLGALGFSSVALILRWLRTHGGN